MPQAAFADSTTAPTGQQIHHYDIDVFDDTLNELEALAYLVSDAFEDGPPSQNVIAGISSLLKGRVSELRSVFDGAVIERQQISAKVMAYEEALTSATARVDALVVAATRDQQDTVKWLPYNLHLRILEIINVVRAENGQPVYATYEDWPETEREAVVSLSKSYARKILDKLDNPDDALEAGSFLPWIETVIRRELSNVKPQPAGAMLRDKFILDSVEDGFSTADIAQALGLSRHSVDKAVLKLKRGQPRNQDEDEAQAG